MMLLSLSSPKLFEAVERASSINNVSLISILCVFVTPSTTCRQRFLLLLMVDILYLITTQQMTLIGIRHWQRITFHALSLLRLVLLSHGAHLA